MSFCRSYDGTCGNGSMYCNFFSLWNPSCATAAPSAATFITSTPTSTSKPTSEPSSDVVFSGPTAVVSTESTPGYLTPPFTLSEPFSDGANSPDTDEFVELTIGTDLTEGLLGEDTPTPVDTLSDPTNGEKDSGGRVSTDALIGIIMLAAVLIGLVLFMARQTLKQQRYDNINESELSADVA